MKRIEKDWTELDAADVDFDESGNWHWGRGGSPLGDWEFSIIHVTDDLVETRYRLPDCVNIMLRRQEEYGAESARRKIRHAMGV